jgi:hypothetical protein
VSGTNLTNKASTGRNVRLAESGKKQPSDGDKNRGRSLSALRPRVPVRRLSSNGKITPGDGDDVVAMVSSADPASKLSHGLLSAVIVAAGLIMF